MVSPLVTGRAKIARLAAKSKTQALKEKKYPDNHSSKQSSLSLGKLFLLQLTKCKGQCDLFVRLALRDMN